MSGLERVILLGENHLDPFKMSRYEKALEHFKLNIFTYELPKNSAKIPLDKRIPHPINLVGDLELSGEVKSILAGTFYSENQDLFRIYLSHKLNFLFPFKAIDNYKNRVNGELLKQVNEIANEDTEELFSDEKENQFLNQYLDLYYKYIPQDYLENLIAKIEDEGGAAIKKFNTLLVAGSFYILNNQQLGLSNGFKLDLSKLMYWDIASIDVISGFKEFDLNEESFYINRDSHMIGEILNLSGTVVHGGGYAHFYASYDNMYEKLKRKGQEQGFIVERYLLPEIDNL